MGRYLQNKDKISKYRVVSEYNRDTNDFPRTINGDLDDSFDDLYIRCSKGNKIYSYGYGVLVAYIPSTGRGSNILKSLPEGIAFDIEKTDKEILFKFKYKHLDKVASLLKAHVNQKDKDGNYKYISPFSNKNLPKSKVKIPDEELSEYKELISKLGENPMLIIKNINNIFMDSLVGKSFNSDDLKADMKLKGCRGKEYFYLIGKFNDYLEFISKQVTK